MPYNPLLAKLETFTDLRESDRALLAGLCRDIRTFEPKRHVIREGDRPQQVHLMVEGWAARYKAMPDGSRQIVAFLLPGDFCDLHVAILGEMDHAIVAVTQCRVAFIPSAEMDELTSHHEGLTRALWWGTLVDEAVLRSWIANNGRREAEARIAHLLCELHARMKLIGLVSSEDRFNLPITQEEIADATGLTPVHTNRMLQRLRQMGLIDLHDRVLTVLDLPQLRRVAGFDPNYLHIVRRLSVPG